VDSTGGPDQGEKPTEKLASWIEEAQNLQVHEALDQIGASWAQIMLILAGLVVVFLFAGGVLRPGGFKSVGIRDVKPWPAVMWLFVGMLVFLAYPVAGGAAADADWLFPGEGEPGEVQRQAVSMACGSVAAALVGFGVLFSMGKSAPDAGLRAGPMDLLIGIGGFLLAYPLIEVVGIGSAAVYQQMTGQAPATIAHETLSQIVEFRGNPWIWVLIGAVVVGVPIMEELVFRAGLQSALLRMTGSPWAAILATSAGFTALHWGAVPPDGWYAFATLFVLSVALGVAFERSKKIGVPIAMHMLFNGLTIAIALSGDPAAGGSDDDGPAREGTPSADVSASGR